MRLDPGRARTIGRSRSCDIVLAEPRVSGTHARVVLESGELRIVDHGSRNGTWLTSVGEERRVEPPGVEVALAPDDAIRIGPFHLVPCEVLGDDVVVSASACLDMTAETAWRPTASGEDQEEPSPARLEQALRALSEKLTEGDPGPTRTWRAVLHALLELLDAERGVLLAPSGDGYVLRASRGTATLSKHFISRTAERRSVWNLTPVGESAEVTPSIGDLGPGVTLTGVPLRDANGGLIAVGYFERSPLAATEHAGAPSGFVALAASMLAMADEADRQRRRSEALATRDAAGAMSDEHSVALVGSEQRFLDAVETVRRAAGSNANVLVRGPSGSGKEQLARLAHAAGPRRGRPFVVLNCAALPETLIESELFGVDRGAYTGADRSRPGAFAQAHDGTLFLDEVGDLPLAAQAKILRAIETGEVVRVGGSRTHVDVRLVTATHRDLEAMIREGSFREDLYYRLRVIEVRLPALAERAGDILPLAEHFLQRVRRTEGIRVDGISVGAARCLQRYEWPGNVRELLNVVDRAVVLDRDGVLDVDDLPEEIRRLSRNGAADGPLADADILSLPWPEAKDRFEERYFRSALQRHGGAVQQTARAIGVDRRTISSKIARFRLRDITE